jgi:hypothetical protein
VGIHFASDDQWSQERVVPQHLTSLVGIGEDPATGPQCLM